MQVPFPCLASEIAPLIVDDEPLVLDMLQNLLDSRGFAVATAASARAAIPMIQASIFELVVTDMRMETPTSGFNVTHVAKAQLPRVVVAILTVFPMPGTDWRNDGADSLFTKGVTSSA